MTQELESIATYKKKENMAAMFDTIAPHYDFLNHFFSLSIDKQWRKSVVKRIPKIKNANILDVSTGTADMAIAIAKKRDCIVTGVDISSKMLEIGKAKIQKKKLSQKITLQQCDVVDLPFQENTFDACTVAFGVRNFEFLEKGLLEMYKVLKPSGKLIILEFSNPEKAPFKQFYAFYSKKILPFIGRLVSKNKTAYAYLPNSVAKFASKENFVALLNATGFKTTTAKSYTFGIVTIYTATK